MNSSMNLIRIITLFFVLSQTFLTSPFVSGQEISDDGHGNEANCFTETTEIQPFKLLEKSERTLRNPIERMFFNQKIKEIKCSNEGAECFKGVYDDSHGKAECVTIKAPISLYFGKLNSEDSNTIDVKIGVGCACNIRKI